MLSMSPSIAGTVACAFLVAVVPIATNGQEGRQDLPIMDMISQSIKDAIPANCTGSADAEFEMAVACGGTHSGECRGLLGLITELGNIPSAFEIETCEDINDPFCTFANACEICAIDFEALVTCVVLETEGIDSNTTDFIDSCSLGCGDDVVVEDRMEGNIISSNDGI